MIVEFAGLPGAGKSTLRTEVGAALRAAGVDVDLAHLLDADPRRVRRGARRARAVLAHRAALRVAARAMRAGGRPWPERLFGLRLLAVTLDSYQRAAGSDRLVLLDEGIVQRGFLALTGDRRPGRVRDVTDFAGAVPTPDVVVVLRVDPATAITRVGGRDRPMPARYRRLDSDNLVAKLTEASMTLDLLVSVLARRPDHPVVIACEALHNPTINAARIVSLLIPESA